MARNKRRRTKSLSAAIRDDKRTIVKVKQVTQEFSIWCDLPVELLELILRHLTLLENRRFSAVCKRWYSIAISMRPVNQPPWIMYFPKSGNVYEFYDPLCRKLYSIELKELAGSRVCYTKDGWLLLYKYRDQQLFFFNPYTRELIKLPNFAITYHIVAFSGDPKSSSCVVIILLPSPAFFVISTCHPGEIVWTVTSYQNPVASTSWTKLIFSNGKFYCLSLTGWLGIFDLKELSWKILVVPLPNCVFRRKFLAEHEGNILMIDTCSADLPFIYKLDQAKMVWEEVKHLGGITLFVSFLSSTSRIDLPEKMRSRVYFPQFCFYGKRCISYSVKGRRCYPHKEFGNRCNCDINSFEIIWIDCPQDLSIFM